MLGQCYVAPLLLSAFSCATSMQISKVICLQHSSKDSVIGTLFLTDRNLIFVEQNRARERWVGEDAYTIFRLPGHQLRPMESAYVHCSLSEQVIMRYIHVAP